MDLANNRLRGQLHLHRFAGRWNVIKAQFRNDYQAKVENLDGTSTGILARFAWHLDSLDRGIQSDQLRRTSRLGLREGEG
jgi:hypothetical protein